MPVMVDATNDGRGDAMPGRGDGRTVPALFHKLTAQRWRETGGTYLNGVPTGIPDRLRSQEHTGRYRRSSCPVRRDLHAWRLLNLQPLAALAGRPQQWHNLGNTPLRDGRQVGSQDARRIENGV
uniref:Uncharacterized protein B12J7.020 n=1 Tax=Neurospora crassa TaxID=5141 RepID=Q6MV04_NEUCS|nr:hypothetical protein [Neurospora crassa]